MHRASTSPIARRLSQPALLGVLATSALVLLDARPAGACSCAATTDAEALRHADAVFSGTLVDRAEPWRWLGAASGDRVQLVFEVDRVVKGEVHERQTVATPRDDASCGLGLRDPGPYLVFADEGVGSVDGAAAGELHTGACSATRSLAGGGLPEVLGQGADPIPGSSPADGGPVSARTAALVAGVVIALATLGVVIRRRRRRSPR